MLVVSHEMGFAREVANRMVLMDAGQIIESNEPSNSSSTRSTSGRSCSCARFCGDARLVATHQLMHHLRRPLFSRHRCRP